MDFEASAEAKDDEDGGRFSACSGAYGDLNGEEALLKGLATWCNKEVN